MTLVGICDRCAEEKPTHVPHERRRLRHGPDGEHLCARHAREAWDEQLDDDLVPDGGTEDGRVSKRRKRERSGFLSLTIAMTFNSVVFAVALDDYTREFAVLSVVSGLLATYWAVKTKGTEVKTNA